MRGSELDARLSEAIARRTEALGATRDALKACQEHHRGVEAAIRASLHAIAEGRLTAADRREPLEALGAVDALLGKVSAARARALEELRAKQSAAAEALQQAQATEAAAADRAAASRATADRLCADALGRFAITPSYQRLQQDVDSAAEAREVAEGHLQAAQRALAAFHASVVHPVHRYLRDRRYATPGYAGSFVGATLDAFAARASRYPEVFLREQLLVGAVQAALSTAQAATARHTLAEQELEAAEDSIVAQSPAGSALERAEQDEAALAERHSESADKAGELRQIQDAIATHEAGQDEAAREAREQVVEVLLRTSTQVRLAAVGETAAPDDDVAAAEAAELEAKLRDIAREAQALSAQASAQMDALDSVEAVLKLARKRGWTSSRSRFQRLDLDSVLATSVLGSEGLAQVSQSLERAHYEEPPPRPSTSSSWSGNSGGWRTGGGFGGTSRATGGGFGGGGRRTGGGF